ncbi:hypothetical protein [Chelativorans sp. AA-79]|uniref:DUF7927 domain-containing protein n=1 Tax=Chelativorans sp. AA-79 TaxID=3028735 RepID=UPI0023F9B53A|nr:hypothetical protein [Chelativorans sp. AA-79]WEX10576.1 hypothetical protein PVE73_06355 [Chelativorans sp. AA-79]
MLTYTVTLTNSGAAAAHYDLADNIDDLTTYVPGTAMVDGAAREPAGADPLTWADILVPRGSTVDVVYSVRVADTIPDGVTEIANVAYKDGDPEPDCTVTPKPDGCVTVPTPGTAVPSKDLTDEDGLVPDVAEPGETLTYTVTLTNNDSSAALYDLRDNIDALTSYLAGSTSGTANAGEPDASDGDTLLWADIVVPANGSVTVIYSVTVADEIPSGVTEISNVAYKDGDPEPDCSVNPPPDGCETVPTPGTATPEKNLTDEDGLVSGVAEPGETLTYTVTLTNAGPVAALYDLRDNIDALTSYLAGSTSGTANAGEPDASDGDTLLWADIVVPANGNVTVVYSVTVADEIPSGVTEISNVAYKDGDPEPDCSTTPMPDGCVTVPTPGTATPEKDLTAEDGLVADTAEPGETLTYTVTLTNAGSAAALYDLKDNIDDNTTYVAGTARVGGAVREPVGSDPLTWADIVVPANDTVDVVYSVKVVDTIPADVTEIGNVAYRDGDPEPDCTVDPLPAGCVVVPTPGTAVPSKSLTEEDGQTDGIAEPGEVLTYTVTLTNAGTAAALYDLADNIDDNTAYVAGTATVDGAAVEPTGSDPLVWADLVVPAGGTLAVEYQVTVDDPLDPTVTEIVNLAYREGDPEPDCDADPMPEACVKVPAPAPAVTLEKTGRFADENQNGVADAGETIVYTFTVANEGNVPLDDVMPRDAGPTFNKARAMGAFSEIKPVSGPSPVTLAPQGEDGSTREFTASYTLTQVDIDNGAGIENGVENTATALGYAFGTAVTGGMPVESNEDVAVLALPAAVSDLTVTKIANLRFIRRGEQAPFTIRVTNSGPSQATGITVIDTMPAGFRYVEGSATVGGAEVTPEIAGRQIRFADVAVPGNGEIEIRLRLLALSTAGPGEHVNLAHAQDSSGNKLTATARAVVEIIVEPVFDCGDIIGKVFDDINRNGYQDPGEPGLPGVRVATVKGWLITTDEHGRFHVACADLPEARIGSNFIMKLDPRTLPTGYRLTTENPRVVRLTAGKMTELNFGASIGRVVRLDLAAEAFVPGEAELSAEWAAGIDQLIEVLSAEQSVLRLSYVDAAGDETLAEARVKRMKELIADRWRRRGRAYPLDIETRVEAGQ